MTNSDHRLFRHNEFYAHHRRGVSDSTKQVIGLLFIFLLIFGFIFWLITLHERYDFTEPVGVYVAPIDPTTSTIKQGDNGQILKYDTNNTPHWTSLPKSAKHVFRDDSCYVVKGCMAFTKQYYERLNAEYAAGIN